MKDSYDTRAYHDNTPDPRPTIVIERREVIGTILPDSAGSMTMLQAAYAHVGTWMENTIQTDGLETPIQVEFVYGPTRFRASAEPA